MSPIVPGVLSHTHLYIHVVFLPNLSMETYRNTVVVDLLLKIHLFLEKDLFSLSFIHTGWNSSLSRSYSSILLALLDQLEAVHLGEFLWL